LRGGIRGKGEVRVVIEGCLYRMKKEIAGEREGDKIVIVR
jgi:hypothetical protein